MYPPASCVPAGSTSFPVAHTPGLPTPSELPLGLLSTSSTAPLQLLPPLPAAGAAAGGQLGGGSGAEAEAGPGGTSVQGQGLAAGGAAALQGVLGVAGGSGNVGLAGLLRPLGTAGAGGTGGVRMGRDVGQPASATGELQAPSSKYKVTIYMSYQLRLTSYKYEVTIYMSYQLRLTS